MCGGPESSVSDEVACDADDGHEGLSSILASKTAAGSSYLLELAASNDLEGFKDATAASKAKVDLIGTWYCRQIGTNQMILEQRTPAMLAALYGSVDVLNYILTIYSYIGGNINERYGTCGSTALHCAAAGGSIHAIEVVRLLLSHGANLDVLDEHGRRPFDVIAKFPGFAHMESALRSALKAPKNTETTPLVMFEADSVFPDDLYGRLDVDAVENGGLLAAVKSVSTSPETIFQSLFSSTSPSSSTVETAATKTFQEDIEKVKEYAMDPTILDLKNSIYTTDDFRMYSCKVRPCSRAYSHDWTECPFAHPGENARRRDPRRYHYSCVPCPDFRKGTCRQGDACEYAHGVFECWLHPAQYRTRLCKDGTACTRRVCFFAHTTEELRPLCVSIGAAVSSPRGTVGYDMATMSPPLTPASPSSVLMASPFASSQNSMHASLATPPMSPSSPSTNNGTWSQANIPALYLPGASLQASRLRTASSARDLPLKDLGKTLDFDGHLMNEFAFPSQTLSTQARLNAALAASASGTTSSWAGKFKSLALMVAPTNLEEMFEVVSSPSPSINDSYVFSQLDTQLQCHKSYQLQNQSQPSASSQVSLQMMEELQLQQASTFTSFDAENQGLNGSSFSPSVVAARAAFALRDKRSHSFRDLGTGATSVNWGSPTGMPEWGIQGDDLIKLRKSASFGYRRSQEPDFPEVRKVVKEPCHEVDCSAPLWHW